MKAKKVAAGIVVLVLVIVSVLYSVVEYNYHGHLYEWCIPAMRRNAAQYFIDNWRSELGQEDSVWISQSGLNDLKLKTCKSLVRFNLFIQKTESFFVTPCIG